MRMRRICTLGWVLVILGAARAADVPDGEVTLKRRWRGVRQVVQKTAEGVKFRWAMPATISRRGFVGSADDKPLSARAILENVCQQAHLTCEMMNAVLVVHAPQDARREILIARLKSAEASAKLAALCELGALGDAQAWPVLAQVVTGEDVAAALAAAQALRRMDGEEELDWRTTGVSWDDPEFGSRDEPAPPWQMPMGLAFPECVPSEAVEKLANSRYIPLREAAARLAPGLGEKGKALAETLGRDPSPIVRTAALRSQRGMGTRKGPFRVPSPPEKVKPPAPPRGWRRASWVEPPITNLKWAAQTLKGARQHDVIWRTTGRKIGYLGTPQAIKVLVDYGRSGEKLSQYAAIPLAEFCGGPEAIGFLRERAAEGDGWALWGLSAMQDGEDLVESIRPILESGRPRWDAPPEFTAARWGGIHAVRPLLKHLDQRGHWVCLALGHIGGPLAVHTLAGSLNHADPGVAVSAAKGLGETGAYAAIQPLIVNLRHADRLRRHWAVLGLGRIGGPDAAKALRELLATERARKDRLVRKAAVETLKEIGPLSTEAAQLIAEFEQEDAHLVPEYRPRSQRFDETFPLNQEVYFKDHSPKTYCSIGETRVVMDWANRLLLRYGGCTPCYSNECFAFDVGSATWFPIRAANHFSGWNNELRPNAGCSRGMVYDGVNRLTWIGGGIGAGPNPGAANYGRHIGLAGYDAALDRFCLPANAATMATNYTGEPAKAYAFDSDAGLVISSKSGSRGIGLLDVRKRETFVRTAPPQMPTLDCYPPPAFAYDPVARLTLCTHPKINWQLILYDPQANTWRFSTAKVPGQGDIKVCGGLVYDSLNRAMILVGGVDRDGKAMPTCLYDRKADQWVDLQVKGQGNLRGGDGLSVFDPEHNVILGIHGGAYRYKSVPVGTKAFYGTGSGFRVPGPEPRDPEPDAPDQVIR